MFHISHLDYNIMERFDHSLHKLTMNNSNFQSMHPNSVLGENYKMNI